MNDRPLVSVLVKSYNQKHVIEACVLSVLNQTYNPLEIVIVDDHSTDGTFELVEELVRNYCGTHKIILSRNETNLGIGKNFEKGVGLCHGELFFNVDGDDVCHQNRVEKSVNEWLKNGKAATIVYNDCIEIDQNGKVLGYRVAGHERLPWVHGAVMAYKTSAVKAIGGHLFPGLPNDRSIHDDWVYAIRAALQGEILFVKGVLMFYRIGSGNSNAFGYELISTKVSAGKRRKASIEYMRKEIDTLFVGVSEKRRDEVCVWMDKYANISDYDILKYGGRSWGERWEGFSHHPAGHGRWWSYTFWLRDLPLLLPRWLGYLPLCLYARLYAFRKRIPYLGKRMEDFL